MGTYRIRAPGIAGELDVGNADGVHPLEQGLWQLRGWTSGEESLLAHQSVVALDRVRLPGALHRKTRCQSPAAHASEVAGQHQGRPYAWLFAGSSSTTMLAPATEM